MAAWVLPADRFEFDAAAPCDTASMVLVIMISGSSINISISIINYSLFVDLKFCSYVWLWVAFAVYCTAPRVYLYCYYT